MPQSTFLFRWVQGGGGDSGVDLAPQIVQRLTDRPPGIISFRRGNTRTTNKAIIAIQRRREVFVVQEGRVIATAETTAFNIRHQSTLRLAAVKWNKRRRGG